MTAIELDHTIIPASDKEASARFFARLFGLPYDGLTPPFAPVRVNDRLTLDFFDKDEGRLHYAFKVSDEQFDAIFGRIRRQGIAYGSGPSRSTDMRSTNARRPRRLLLRPQRPHPGDPDK